MLPPALPARLPDNTNFSNPAIPLGARESGTKLGYSAWPSGGIQHGSVGMGSSGQGQGLVQKVNKKSKVWLWGERRKEGQCPFKDAGRAVL